jgi:hypothetical protein
MLFELFGVQAVALVLPKEIATVLVERSHGKLVPVIVILSAPIKLREVIGCADAIEQETVCVATVPAFGIIPRYVSKVGVQSPQTGALSRVQSMLVIVRVLSLIEQVESANMIEVIFVALVGKLDPTRFKVLAL